MTELLLGERVGTGDTARATWRVSDVIDAAFYIGEVRELSFPQDCGGYHKIWSYSKTISWSVL